MLKVPTSPRALRSTMEIDRRRSMLGEPHIAPLTEWVATLRRKSPDEEFPDFDPIGGGVHSDILFVLEKPGPRTSFRGGGSGFISVDNDDETAEASHYFMSKAGIDRNRACHWNIIPGWNRSIEYKSRDWKLGIPVLVDLLSLLPNLKVAILVGVAAQNAEKPLLARGLNVVKSAHPSRKVQNIYPEKWVAIPEQWQLAREVADQG